MVNGSKSECPLEQARLHIRWQPMTGWGTLPYVRIAHSDTANRSKPLAMSVTQLFVLCGFQSHIYLEFHGIPVLKSESKRQKKFTRLLKKTRNNEYIRETCCPDILLHSYATVIHAITQGRIHHNHCIYRFNLIGLRFQIFFCLSESLCEPCLPHRPMRSTGGHSTALRTP